MSVKTNTMEDDDIDIYEDLPSFGTNETQKNKELSEKCSKLEADNTGLKAQVEAFTEMKKVIERNFSSLMKTAKAEIARKDRMIAQLRRELDNAAFRRGKTWKKQPIQQERYKESKQIVEQEKSSAPFVKAHVPRVPQTLQTISSDESDEEIMLNEKPNNLTATVFGERLKRKLMLEQEAERRQREEAKIAALEKAAKEQATKIQPSINSAKLEEEKMVNLNKAVKVEEFRIAALNKVVKVEESRIAALDKAVKVEEDRIAALNNPAKAEEGKGATLVKTVNAKESKAAALNEPRKVEKTEIETLAKTVKVQKDKIAIPDKPIKALEEENKKHRNVNGFVKNEDKKLQDKLNGAFDDKKTPDRSSAAGSTSSRHSHEEDNKSLCTRRTLKTKASDKREGSANSDLKRKRVEEEKLHKDDTRHHNGHSKYEDNRHNFESLDNPTKYPDHKRNIHNSRDEYERVKQLRGEKSKSSYRSHSNDRRYNERRPDRHRTDKYRTYNDKHEKRRDYGHSREGENWIEGNKGINDLRDKIESKVGGSGEYNNYNDDTWEKNCKRQSRTSHSPEKNRSRSSGRIRDKDYEKRRSRRSRSSDRFINSKNSADSDGERRKIERSKVYKATRVGSKDRDTNCKSEDPLAISKNINLLSEETDNKISLSDVVVNSSILIKEKTTLESGDECRKIEILKKDSEKDSKGAKTESNANETESNIPPASLKINNQIEETKERISASEDIEKKIGDTDGQNDDTVRRSKIENTKDEISASEVTVNDSLPDTEKQIGDAVLENVEPTSSSENKLDDQVDNTGKSVSVLENDTEVPPIIPSTPEPAEVPPETPPPASRSFREEKIENIEKFIQDYEENEHFCVPIVNEESDDHVNSSSSTDSIVDTLSMDIDEFPLDKKSEFIASINSPNTCKLDINDVAAEVEVDIEDSPLDKTSELVVGNNSPVISSENVKDIGAEVEVNDEDFSIDKKSEHVASENPSGTLNVDMEDVMGELKMDVEEFPLDEKLENVAENDSPKTAKIDSESSEDIAVESKVDVKEKASENVDSNNSPKTAKMDSESSEDIAVESEVDIKEKESEHFASTNSPKIAKIEDGSIEEEKSEHVASSKTPDSSKMDIKDFAGESKETTKDLPLDKESVQIASRIPEVTATAVHIEVSSHDGKSDNADSNNSPDISKLDIENLTNESGTKIGDSDIDKKSEIVVSENPQDAPKLDLKDVADEAETDVKDLPLDDKSENAVSNNPANTSNMDIKDLAANSEEKIKELPLAEKTKVVIVNDLPDACKIDGENLEKEPKADFADVQQSDQKSENVVSDELPDESKTDVKDVDDESETISKTDEPTSKSLVSADVLETNPKIDKPTSECPAPLSPQTLEYKQIVAVPESSEVKNTIEKHPTDKAIKKHAADKFIEKQTADKVIEKQLKRRLKTVATPIMSRYSKRKPSILADSEASHCIIESGSTKNTETINISNEESKTQRIPMEELNAQQAENSTNKSDSQSRIPIKQANDVNSFNSKNLTLGLEIKNAITDFERNGETKIENSENSLSAPVGEKDFLQTKLRPDLSSKLEAAPKLRNALESAELRETRSTLKTILAAVSSIDSKTTHRKRALPKAEAESQSKPPAKQCKIIITARRRRPMQLEDSCTATTLIPSMNDVHNGFAKNNCLKAEKLESSKLVLEPAIKGRKRRSNDNK